MNTTTTAPKAIADLIADENTPPWVGPSGEMVTGEAVALHLEATVALLERVGWARTYAATDTSDAPDTAEAAPGDSSTMREMLRWLVRIVRTELDYSVDKRRTLCFALMDVANSDAGDDDTRSVAEKVLAAVLRSRTGARQVAVFSWSSRLGRTWDEVAALLAEAAEVARAYGPAHV